MASIREVTLTCDVCGGAKDVKSRALGLDGKSYEIDLCRKDGAALDRIAAKYIAKARRGTSKPRHRRGQRDHGARRRMRQQKRIFVYGILPADIELTADMHGVGEPPGLLRVVRFDGVAALISDTGMSGRARDIPVLRQAVDRLGVACVVREPVHKLDLGNVAFLADLTKERDVERVIEDLAREWEGRIDLQLLGPMAAYDFAGTAQPGT